MARYEDSLTNRIVRSYHKNSELKQEVNHISNSKDKVVKSYHENGNLESKVNYRIEKYRSIDFNNKSFQRPLN